jgi:CO dehydrogenase maturation factor
VRVAFVGKGGSGKSTIVGTVARVLAAAGERTVVLDSDVMPGPAGAMGIEPSDDPIPDEAVVEKDPDDEGARWRLRDDVSPSEAVQRYALRGPDDVRLLQFGKLRTDGVWTIAPSLHAFSDIKRRLADPATNGGGDWHVLGDLPGGTRQPFFGWGDFASLMVVVVEPTVKSFVTARRLARRAAQQDAPRLVAVANKVERDEDAELVAAESGLEVIGAVPRDRAVVEADRDGTALIDHAPDGPASTAIRSLVERLREAT